MASKAAETYDISGHHHLMIQCQLSDGEYWITATFAEIFQSPFERQRIKELQILQLISCSIHSDILHIVGKQIFMNIIYEIIFQAEAKVLGEVDLSTTGGNVCRERGLVHPVFDLGQ